MDINIIPHKLKGKVRIPSSKSLAHRAIIWGSTGGKIKRIESVDFSDDVIATLNAMRGFGAKIEIEDNNINIVKKAAFDKECTIDCNESGTTLRLLIPLALKNKFPVTFIGAQRLMERPIDNYLEIFPENIKHNGNSIVVSPLTNESDVYKISGGLSSQFASGMLLAFDKKAEIVPPIVSKTYIDLTRQIMAYDKEIYTCEGDFSAAAFWLVANAIGNDVEIENLPNNSLQGDREVIQVLKDDAEIIDIDDIPDSAPILCVWATFRDKPIKLINTKRLKIKESDRGQAMTDELTKLGVDIKNFENEIHITPSKIYGGEVHSHNDHRIAMSLAIAASMAEGEVVIKNAGCTNKSYPGFWEQYKELSI